MPDKQFRCAVYTRKSTEDGLEQEFNSLDAQYETCAAYRKLVVNEAEAEQVRHIMRRYLELGNVTALVIDLNREGYRTKVQRRTSGPHRGGCTYQRGTLYHLLSNRIYRGLIVHKGEAYPGEHQPIVDEALWQAVQDKLAANASGPSKRSRHQHPSLLVGKLLDGEGRPMTPSHAARSGRRYRYYVLVPTRSKALVVGA